LAGARLVRFGKAQVMLSLTPCSRRPTDYAKIGRGMWPKYGAKYVAKYGAKYVAKYGAKSTAPITASSTLPSAAKRDLR
jgi:hypothetical protein